LHPKWIDFELPKPDGTLTKIALRRPHWWLREIGADSVEKKVYLNMPELGSQGWATVKAIRVNQLDTRFWNENRKGDYVSRPITGKFEHESNDVYYLHFGDNPNPLGVTGSHPIWSTDRNDWVGAKDLQIGEKVKTQEGLTVLKSRTKSNKKQKVYNLEIYKDHNFLVSTDKILVHNSCVLLDKLDNSSIEGAKELMGNIYKDGDKLRADINFYTKQEKYGGSLTDNLLDHLDKYMSTHKLDKLEINFIDAGQGPRKAYKKIAEENGFKYSETPNKNYVEGVNPVYDVKMTNF
jgi:hypothetical protein